MSPSAKSSIFIFAMVLVALASYIQGVASELTWFDLLTVRHFFGLLGVAAGVIVAGSTKTPRDAKKDAEGEL